MLKKVLLGMATALLVFGVSLSGAHAVKTTDDVYDKLTDIETEIGSKPEPATAITIKTVSIAAVNTEYSITLPDNTKGFTFHTRGGDAFRWSPVPGKVAAPTEPYFTVPSNGTMDSSEVPNADFDGITLYFAAPTSGDTVELVAYY